MKFDKEKINKVKSDLIQLFCDKLKKELEIAKAQFENIRQAAVNAPGAMQSHHDVSKDEFSKLAVNLENRIMQINEALKILDSYVIKDLSTKKINLENH